MSKAEQPYVVRPDFISHRKDGAGRLWRCKKYGELYLLAQVGRTSDKSEMLYVFLSLGGNRHRDPCTFNQLPFEKFTRVTEQTAVLFT